VPATPRELARRVLARVERDRAWATLALDGELTRSGLDERDRRLAAELVYGVLRHRARLDRAIAAYADLKRTPPAALLALRVAAYQLLLLDRIPAHAAVDDAVGAARQAGGAKVAGFVNAVLRKLATAGEPPLPDDPRAALEIRCSMPGWIVDELAAALPSSDQLDAAADALTRPAPLWARANLRRASRDEVRAALEAEGATVEPGPTAASLKVSELGDPAASASFRAGLWTVQDLGAQRVGELAGVAGVSRVLDACAGVGGKSTHLAELLGPDVRIDAADVSKAKLELAAASAARLGHANITPVRCDLLDPRAPLGDAYDVIVVDAPCTGLGVLRRHPEARWRLTPDDVGRAAEVQARLLDALIPRLAPGGTLVYSVCTFTRREGKDQIARLPLALDVEHSTWPHVDDADAFYLARLRARPPA
jgi:16S rRNA (cytosine967-C5)-methyltransferase